MDEKKYIEQEQIVKLAKEIKNNFAPLHNCVIDAFIHYIDHNIPSADVVEVVRCEDCTYYESYRKPVEDFDGRCFARGCETDEMDFCNYGAKMDGKECNNNEK